MNPADVLTRRVTSDVIRRVTVGRRDRIPPEWGDRLCHYLRVPKEFESNLLYRRALLRAGASDRRTASVLWQMCRDDLLFWVNSFVWTYANKEFPDAPNRPFVTWPYQDVALLEIDDAISGRHPLHVCKSRDVGATWMVLVVFLHRILFRRGQTFLVISRKQDLVDKLGDEDSLFAKLDFVLRFMPRWLYPQMERKLMTLRNPELHSAINGESTTGESGRGGRRNAIMVDEMQTIEDDMAMMAAISAVSDCRIYCGTPAGMANEFARTRQRTQHRLEMHWSLHPLHAAGLYTRDGKARSPWYDRVTAGLHPITIAQEYDMDFVGSVQRFFRDDVMGPYIQEFARRPVGRFDLETAADGSIVSMRCCPDGMWEFWEMPDARNRWPDDRKYVVACDVAYGTGATNSVMVVVDAKNRSKVAEFASGHIDPHSFARMAVSVCRWFRGAQDTGDRATSGAFLIWENNGGGGASFGQEVLRQGYRNVYFARKEHSADRPQTTTAGWNSTATTKKLLLGDLYNAYAQRKYANHSQTALEEARQYVFVPSRQAVIHAESMNAPDPSGAGINHGDRVIADALAVRAMAELGETPQAPPRPPPGSYAEEREEYERRKAQEDLWSEYSAKW